MYTDAEEVILEVTRPIILNGIGEIIHRPDLASRALIIELPVIPKKDRKLEDDLKRKFQKYHPCILRAFLNAASYSLHYFNKISLPRSPRMVDFTKWAIAGGKYFGWDEMESLNILEQNWQKSSGNCLEADVVGTAIYHFIEKQRSWEGTVSDLKKEIELANIELQKHQYWPQNTTSFSKRMRRMSPVLREFGVTIEDKKRSAKHGRRIKLNF